MLDENVVDAEAGFFGSQPGACWQVWASTESGLHRALSSKLMAMYGRTSKSRRGVTAVPLFLGRKDCKGGCREGAGRKEAAEKEVAERIAKEAAEKERVAKEAAEKERIAKEAAEKEAAEKDRIAKEAAEKERQR